jgi:hypothetical protein
MRYQVSGGRTILVEGILSAALGGAKEQRDPFDFAQGKLSTSLVFGSLRSG